MATQNDGDIVDRALARQRVLPQSSMEKWVRSNMYAILVGDPSGWDEKLDAFVGQYRNDDFYSKDFVALPKPPVETVKQPTVQELAVLAGKAPGAQKAAASETRPPQMGDIVQPTAEEFKQLVG
jgi:hypothetical protein